jgi:molybdopterin-guanine dinucleotide biosynthesis protein A
MVPKAQLTLAILAGGKGFRLGGVDKARLVYQGRTLLDRLLDLRTLCAEALVIRDDVVPGKGAPGGVVTALLAAKTPWVLIACCDMPRVTAASVEALLAAAPPALFEVGQETRLEPFPGVYAAAWGPMWKARLSANPSMGLLLGSVECSRVPTSDLEVVRSVNTPEDARSLGVDVDIP